MDLFSLIGTVLLAVVIYYVYQVISWYRRILVIGRQVDKLPHDQKHWLYGTLREHPGPNEEGIFFMVDLARRHGGRIFSQWFGPFRPGVFFHHPDTVKLVLKTTEPKAVLGNGPYRLIFPWLGDGLLVAGGAKWQRNRKLLTPAFHFDVLKPYMQVNNEAANILLEKWDAALKARPHESIEIYSPISLCTLDIIMRCALSYTADVQTSKEENLYVNAILSLSSLVTKRVFNLIMYIDGIYYKTAAGKKFRKCCDYVHQVAEDIIKTRKLALENKSDVKNRRMDFLDILLHAKDETGQGLTDLEIRNEVDTFLFEGHDTTASAISWCLYNLARHPDAQEKVYEEVHELLSNRDSMDITWDDVGNELHYLTQCVKESLRLHPPVPFIVRDLANPLEVEGVTLLPGTILDVGIYVLHHNSLVWGEDHMEYKPERFDPENIKKMEPHSFIPFSAGPRNCIGQVFAMHEVKALVAKIIHRYSLELDMDHKVEMLADLVLRAKNGIKLKMTPRN